MKKTTLTHGGTKRAINVHTATGAMFYLSQPVNPKKGGSFLSIGGTHPVTGEQTRVRLSATELRQLRKLLTTA